MNRSAGKPRRLISSLRKIRHSALHERATPLRKLFGSAVDRQTEIDVRPEGPEVDADHRKMPIVRERSE
jgi:hypothetical protein